MINRIHQYKFPIFVSLFTFFIKKYVKTKLIINTKYDAS